MPKTVDTLQGRIGTCYNFIVSLFTADPEDLCCVLLRIEEPNMKGWHCAEKTIVPCKASVSTAFGMVSSLYHLIFTETTNQESGLGGTKREQLSLLYYYSGFVYGRPRRFRLRNLIQRAQKPGISR